MARLVRPGTVDSDVGSTHVVTEKPPLQPVRPRLAARSRPVHRVLHPPDPWSSTRRQHDEGDQTHIGGTAHMDGVGIPQLGGDDPDPTWNATNDSELRSNAFA